MTSCCMQLGTSRGIPANPEYGFLDNPHFSELILLSPCMQSTGFGVLTFVRGDLARTPFVQPIL